MRSKPLIIFAVSDIFLPKLNKTGGGGTISNYLLFKYLAKYFDIHIITSTPYLKEGVLNHDNIKYYNIKALKLRKIGVINDLFLRSKVKKRVSNLVHELHPDLIIGQTNTISVTVPLAEKFNIISAVWIRAFENIHNISAISIKGLKDINKLLKKYLFMKKDVMALNKADIVFTNSYFMKKQVDSYFNLNSKVVYPPIIINSGYEINHKRQIGFIKPTEEKGLKVFLEIASKMPSEKFVVFGDKPADYRAIEKRLKNLIFMGWVNSFEAIYASMKVLLVPSLGPEPFGRVAIEALSYGVIPLVSGKGGLPEAVSNCSKLIIKDYYNIDTWVDRIRYIINNESARNNLLKQQQNNINYFAVDKQGKEMKNIILEQLHKKKGENY